MTGRCARFAIVTFGCQMNRHDSERVAGALIASGWKEVPREEADVLVFNTCTVREGAARRLKGQVASLSSEKRARPELLIAVMGCLAQEEGGALVDAMPQIDLVIGTDQVVDAPELLEAALTGREPVVATAMGDRFASELPSRRESLSRAWVAIAKGCDNRCAYCVVPDVRGPERSRPLEDIEREVAELVDEGVVEVTLLGQNVNSYGRDLYGAPRFAELLGRLDGSGIGRIRFTTSHPKDLADEVIEAVAGCSNVCEHVHLPAQSGNDRILAAMGRGYTTECYLDRVRRLREAVGDVSITTDLMVAFPTETRSESEDTVQLVREVGYAAAFTFIYSPRRGTAAAAMKGAVEHDEARERMSRLVEAVNETAYLQNQRFEGSLQEVLVEGPAKQGAGLVKGRARGGQTVIMPARHALPHQVVEARIVAAHTWFLEGEVDASS
jgi:tRNA-2-methylthio-N6-dimethylallyladenosine synthase